VATSNIETIDPILRFVLDENPKSILDIGVGFGKYGFLCREYLECVKNRTFVKDKWVVRIDGIEAYEKGILPHHEHIYDFIYQCDAEKMDIPDFYDLYLMIDVLEHMYNPLDFLYRLPLSKGLIITVPYGTFKQGAVFGNEYEKHVSFFTEKDFYFFVKEKLLDSFTIVRGPKNTTILGVRKKTG